MNEENYFYRNQISLKELIGIIWNSKYIIIAVTFLSIIFSVSYALSQKNIYKSSVLVAIQDSKTSGISSALSQYGGLASMAGINLPSGGSSGDKTFIVIETIQSRIFFKSLIKKYQVLPQIMAIDSYDKAINQIFYNVESYDDKNKKWLSAEPSFTKSHTSFLGMLNVRQDPKTKFITIEIDHQSPVFANYLLQTILDEVNLIIREQDLIETQSAIDYLKAKVTETQIKDLRYSFNSLITGQQEKQMMADIKKDYVFKIIDPPVVPEFKYKPQRSLIVIYSTVFGFFLSIFIVLFRYFLIIINEDRDK